MKSLRPELFNSLRGYTRGQLVKDLTAGLIVAIIALPLSIALALASGVNPEQGIYTAIIAGFLISFLGGSRVQIAGPTAAFATIVAGIVATYGISGLALATVMATMYALPNGFTGGPNGVSKVPFPELAMLFKTNRDTMYFVVLVIMFLLVIVTLNIINSPMGRAMLAMSNSESLAQAMGVKLLKYRVLAFVIATVYSLLAGVLYVSYMQSSIYATWSSSLAMNILIAACLGGTASPAGVMAGSFVVFTIDYAFLKNIAFFQKYPQASLFFNGILIIIIIAKYPGGLIRLLGAVKYGIKGLFAKGRLYKYGPEE